MLASLFDGNINAALFVDTGIADLWLHVARMISFIMSTIAAILCNAILFLVVVAVSTPICAI